MVLAVGNAVVVKEPPTCLESFLASSSRLRSDVDAFKSMDITTVSEEADRCLYVHQHEFAVTLPGDPEVKVMGSSDATTCHIVILRHATTGVTALAHVDCADGVGNNLRTMTERVLEVSRRLGGGDHDNNEDRSKKKILMEVSIVGGFQDEPGKSEELSLALFKELVKSPVTFILGLCCVGSFNTTIKVKGNHINLAPIPYPVHYGCAVEVDSGRIFPANFSSKGPDEILRHVRCSFNREGSSRLHEIYDSESGQVQIPRFTFHNFSWLKMWVNASPTDILLSMSTSPEVEPDDFVSTLKAAMRMVLENPRPEATVFSGENVARYRRDAEGSWKRIEKLCYAVIEH